MARKNIIKTMVVSQLKSMKETQIRSIQSATSNGSTATASAKLEAGD